MKPIAKFQIVMFVLNYKSLLFGKIPGNKLSKLNTLYLYTSILFMHLNFIIVIGGHYLATS